MSNLSLLLDTAVVKILALIFFLLSLSTGLVYGFKKQLSQSKELTARINSWWLIVALFSFALLFGTHASIVLLALVSYLALKEFFTLIPIRISDRRPLFWAYLAIPLQYYWVSMGWYGMFIIFIPVYLFLWIPLRKVLMGETENFLRSVGMIHWGLMTTVFSLSHAAYLLALPTTYSQNNTLVTGASLLLFLILLTQLNDIFQYLWGKSLGRAKILPSVSPKKTWTGLLGAILSTLVLSLILAPYLTPFSYLQAALAGLIIAIFGFFGDVTISAIKRDLGVKDCGSILPGHGGILDRVDSLTYTAPLFFHYLYYLHY